MGSLRLKRTRSLIRKKQRRSSQSSLANLEVLSPLSWGLQLWRQPSHFWRPLPRLARTISPRLAMMGRNSLEKEITRQWKSKCQHQRKRPRKRRRRTLSQKRKRKWRPKMTLRKTQTSSNPGSVSKDEHLPHAPVRGSDSLVENQSDAA